ncbi:Retrovirus-related Pol polyprotein from transposon, partial [Dictyocoela muelleri]
MPFGLCNAPATLQKVMNTIFKDLKKVLIYMDDILLYSDLIKNYKNLLRQVFSKLKDNNVSKNLDKSEFLKNEIKFLSHKINKSGITLLISRLEKYKKIRPKTKKQLQRLLGFI